MSDVLPSNLDLARQYITENQNGMGVNAVLSVKGFARWLDARVAAETTTEPASKYQRAVWFLQDIASLAGSTKRKQAGCEIAAHALAQLGEPRESSEKTSSPPEAT